MADRYLIGAPTTWDGSNTAIWSTTSGGSGGASIPTSSDNVFFDANSGSGAITGSGTNNCLSFDASNYTGSFSLQAINVYGSFALGAGVTSFAATTCGFVATSAGKTITTSGVTLTGTVLTFNGNGGAWTLQDNANLTYQLRPNQGTIDTNGKTVTVTSVRCQAQVGTGLTLTLGATTFITTGGWTFDSGAAAKFTVNPGTSTIKLNGDQTFDNAGKIWNNLWCSSGNSTIKSSGTFNDIRADAGSQTLTFTAGTTQTVTTFTVNGVSGGPSSLLSSSSGSAATLSCSSGTIHCDHLSIKDIAATGGAQFIAAYSTDVSGNSGWYFSQVGGASAIL